jgi:cation diffusion facilitator family transporter
LIKNNSLKQGERVAKNSAGVSLFLLIIKVIVGNISGSIVLLTDALDSGIDLLTMIISWISLKISQRKPNEKFPYGYYKIESIISLFISLIILYSAYELIITGYSKLFIISLIKFPLLAIFVSIISLITSLGLSKYLKNNGLKINSQLLISSSKERLTDSFKSGIVFLTIITSFYGIPYIEGIVTIIMSVLIFKIGLSLIKDSIITLMDVSPDKNIELKISKIIKKIKGVENFKELKLRKAGAFIFGEVSISIKKFINVKKAHDISDKIEEEVKNKIKTIDTFIIHIEPFKSSKQKIAIPIREYDELNSKIMNHFGKSNHFIFINLENKKIINFYVKKNINKNRKIRAGLHTVDILVKEKIDVLITNQLGQISFHTLRDNLIDVYLTNETIVKNVIDNYLKNNLKRLNKPTKESD